MGDDKSLNGNWNEQGVERKTFLAGVLHPRKVPSHHLFSKTWTIQQLHLIGIEEGMGKLKNKYVTLSVTLHHYHFLRDYFVAHFKYQ